MKKSPCPTSSHYFFRLLQDHEVLERVYTQNIDGLEAKAGVTSSLLVEAHGNLRTSAVCTTCSTSHPVEQFFSCLSRDQVAYPVCRKLFCSGYVKPRVVFYGEDLPKRYYDLVTGDILNADLLIVAGTSLQVSPICDLMKNLSPRCHRLLINRELPVNAIPAFRAAKSHRASVRVFLKGDCDSGFEKLARLCGWDAELAKLKQSAF